jgi:hypothetical protein
MLISKARELYQRDSPRQGLAGMARALCFCRGEFLMSNQTVTIDPNQRYHLIFQQSKYASTRENISELGAFDSTSNPELQLADFMNLLTDAARALCGVGESSKALKSVMDAVHELPIDYESWRAIVTVIDWYLEPFKPSSWNQAKPARKDAIDYCPWCKTGAILGGWKEADGSHGWTCENCGDCEDYHLDAPSKPIAKPESEDKTPLEKMDSHVHILAGFLAGHLLVSYCLLPDEDLSVIALVIERGLVAGFKYLDIDALTRELKAIKGQS